MLRRSQRERRSQVALYGGIDLHSSNNHLGIVTERQKEVFRRRSANDLGQVLRVLAPYQQDIEGIAVESTYNWCWLVDGLMDEEG
jgi:hypothetical protein